MARLYTFVITEYQRNRRLNFSLSDVIENGLTYIIILAYEYIQTKMMQENL